MNLLELLRNWTTVEINNKLNRIKLELWPWNAWQNQWLFSELLNTYSGQNIDKPKVTDQRCGNERKGNYDGTLKEVKFTEIRQHFWWNLRETFGLWIWKTNTLIQVWKIKTGQMNKPSFESNWPYTLYDERESIGKCLIDFTWLIKINVKNRKCTLHVSVPEWQFYLTKHLFQSVYFIR